MRNKQKQPGTQSLLVIVLLLILGVGPEDLLSILSPRHQGSQSIEHLDVRHGTPL